MKYYKCVKGLTWFSYKGKRRKFATNQCVKVDDSNRELNNIISNHPNFVKEDIDVNTRGTIPKVEQLLEVPEATTYMNRESIINEILSYGVKPDIYAIDDVLSQQLKTLRIMTKKSFITVINKGGKGVYVHNVKEYVDSFKENAKTDESMTDYTSRMLAEKAKKEIPIVKDSEYEKEKKSKKGATSAVVQKDNDDDIQGKSFEEYVDERSIVEKDITNKKDKFIVALNQHKIMLDTEVPDELKYPSDKLHQSNFKYLLDIEDGKEFMLNEFTNEDVENIRFVKNFNHLPQVVVDCYLDYKGVNLRKLYDESENLSKLRNDKVDALKKIVLDEIQTQGDLPYIEINALCIRLKEVESKVIKDFRNAKSSSVNSCFVRMKPYYNKVNNLKRGELDSKNKTKLTNVLCDVSKYRIKIDPDLNYDSIVKDLYQRGFYKKPNYNEENI